MNRVTGLGYRSLLRIEGAEVNIEISPTIMDVETLKDTELVARLSSRGIWKIVLN